MEWQAIGLDQAKLYYDLHLTRDFPPEEMKPFSVITELWQKGQYEAWGCFDPAGRLQAYAYLFWPEGGEYTLLDYYAVLPEYRAAGLGGLMLSRLARLCAPRFKGILIESEDPAHAPDEAMARRRLGFYTRAGAQWLGLGARLFGGHYLICCLPCRPGAALEDARVAMEETYRQLVPPYYYAGNVSIFSLEEGDSEPASQTAVWGG